MNFDWSELVRQGRWDALAIIWNAIVVNVTAYWWFGPLLIVLLVTAGRRGILRLIAYVARAFVHTH